MFFSAVLLDMIKEFNFLGFPLTPIEIREVVWEFAEKNGIKGFGDKGSAGKDWFGFFMKRQKENGLVVKGATDLSLERARATRYANVNNWFTRYQRVLETCEINSPEQIWNVDEHGSEDKIKVKKVVGIKGIRSYQKQPREKSVRTTMLTYVNAAGEALPPLVIHKGKYHDSWRKDAPKDVTVKGSHKGYINKFLFAQYGKKFIYHLQKKKMLDKANLVLIDSHYSHIFNYCYMSIMYTRNVKVMALEAHSSHFSQPLDKNPFSCFKHAFNKAMRRFNRQNGGRPIRKDEFFSVFNVAWQKAMTPENIKAGFKRTGLWPVNKDVFPKEMFRISENSECID